MSSRLGPSQGKSSWRRSQESRGGGGGGGQVSPGPARVQPGSAAKVTEQRDPGVDGRRGLNPAWSKDEAGRTGRASVMGHMVRL